jgi:hypothetical protein
MASPAYQSTALSATAASSSPGARPRIDFARLLSVTLSVYSVDSHTILTLLRYVTMSYQHDVFISYKREPLWTAWTRDHFRALLSSYLQQELGRAPDIFLDERIDVGQDWVKELGRHLATSKVLIGIFSGDYFHSPWCLHELDLMIERQQASRGTLIIPVIVHDGDLIPAQARRLQPAHLEKYRIACIHPETSDYHEFSKVLKSLAPQVAKAIQAAPHFNKSWITHHCKRFDRVFRAALAKKLCKPLNFVAPKLPSQRQPPRLRP